MTLIALIRQQFHYAISHLLHTLRATLAISYRVGEMLSTDYCKGILSE